MAFATSSDRSAWRAHDGWRIDALLTEGGDERIAIARGAGRNRYGCPPAPDGRIAAFGSATCSVISDGAYAHLDRLAQRLAQEDAPQTVYARGARRLRCEIGALCGLGPDDRVVLAASGTDIHLIAADLARGARPGPLTAVLPDPSETGRGVPAALAGAHFGALTPHGGPVVEGGRLDGMTAGAVVAVPLRTADGEARDAEAVDTAFEAACLKAALAGGQVLLTLVDGSKTGLVAPSLACAARLKARLGERIEVLVDACQLRLSTESLAAYLHAGFLVAVTGSKFVTGPPFSGALLVPASAAEHLSRRPPSLGLRGYSVREDWPDDWPARRLLPWGANLGLLLRWEAALYELRAFRALSTARVTGFLRDFAAAVTARLDAEPDLERVAAPPPANRAAGGWDAQPTIFPFLLLSDGVPASPARTEAAWRALRDPALGPEVHLGQPVALGMRDGRPLSALRLCTSARLVVEALGKGLGEARVIARACDAVARTVEMFRRTPGD